MSENHRPPLAAILIIPLAVALVVTLFAWPASKIEPRDLPVGLVGQTNEFPRDAFDVHRYADAAAAREAVEDREVYGALVVTGDRPKMLTASAASPMVAQMLTHAAEQHDAVVEDVVVSPRAGSGVASSVLPLVLAGILTGVFAVGLTRSGLRRAGAVTAGAALAGLATTAIVQGWLAVVEGDWVANAAGLGLTVLAIGAIIAGLEALFGKAGVIAGALTMVLIGNPFSGVGTAPELLPEPVGGLGQLMPPGAGGNLLRSTGFFDGAGAGEHVTVLALWTLAGFLALALSRLREA